MEKLRSGFNVEISGNRYVFLNQIGMDRNLFESFNKLSKSTFGLSFERVGGECMNRMCLPRMGRYVPMFQ